MAGDTRDSSNPKMETWGSSPPSAPPSANALPPGSAQNTFHAPSTDITLASGLKTVALSDFTQVHMYPCARESFITGIGASFTMGFGRAVLGAPIWKSCNWAVGTFCVVTFGAYEACHYKRQVEKAQMKRVVEVMDLKKAEKEKAAEAKREARRRRKEEHDKELEERARGKNSWKFW